MEEHCDINRVMVFYVNCIMACIALLCGRSLFGVLLTVLIDLIATYMLLTFKPLDQKRRECDINMCQECMT